MSDAVLLLKVEQLKKSGWIAALLNLFLPGAGYAYCGNWILGIGAFIFVISLSIATLGYAWPALAVVVFIDGFLCASRRNKKNIAKVLAEHAAGKTATA